MESHFDSEADLQRYEALLEMADLVVHHHSLPELFVALAERLGQVASSRRCPLRSLRSRKKCDARPLLGEECAFRYSNREAGGGFTVGVGLAEPTGAGRPRPGGGLTILTVLTKLREKGLRSYCWRPLTTAQKRLGALGLGSSQTNAYGERDMRLLPRVAKLVAVAVENALTREALVQEKERLHMLLE